MRLGDFEDEWGPTIPVDATKKIGGRVILMGLYVRESSGAAPATWFVSNGTDATGLESVGATLQANESTRDWFGPDGVLLDNGFFPVLTGAVVGAIYVRYDRGARR